MYSLGNTFRVYCNTGFPLTANTAPLLPEMRVCWSKCSQECRNVGMQEWQLKHLGEARDHSTPFVQGEWSPGTLSLGFSPLKAMKWLQPGQGGGGLGCTAHRLRPQPTAASQGILCSQWSRPNFCCTKPPPVTLSLLESHTEGACLKIEVPESH